MDTSPAKERLEDSCVHPLEEAMLGCDMDGEDPGLVGRRALLCSPQILSLMPFLP